MWLSRQVSLSFSRRPVACFCPANTFSGPSLCSANNHYRLCSSGLLWFWGGGCWLALWETRASNETVEWPRWTQWPPMIKASGRIPFDWVCDALWRGLKPKLTSPFDGAATSCGDVSTRCLWNMLLCFLHCSWTSWSVITSRESLLVAIIFLTHSDTKF